jgi:hypothetical protein
VFVCVGVCISVCSSRIYFCLFVCECVVKESALTKQTEAFHKEVTQKSMNYKCVACAMDTRAYGFMYFDAMSVVVALACVCTCVCVCVCVCV